MGADLKRSDENPSSSFGVENYYSPEALFTLLTRDYKSHSIYLQNNWIKISETGYDPISNIQTFVLADLKAKYYPATNRFDKRFTFQSLIYVPSYLDIHLDTFSQTLQKQSIDVDRIDAESFRKKNMEHISYAGEHFVSGSNGQQSVALRVFNHGFSRGNEICLINPWPYPDLNNLEYFAKAQENHFINIGKVIRAIYQTQNKDLPPVKLQFKPEIEKSQEFLAQCSYCKSVYFTAQSLVCPNCSASEPHFNIKV